MTLVSYPIVYYWTIKYVWSKYIRSSWNFPIDVTCNISVMCCIGMSNILDWKGHKTLESDIVSAVLIMIINYLQMQGQWYGNYLWGACILNNIFLLQCLCRLICKQYMLSTAYFIDLSCIWWLSQKTTTFYFLTFFTDKLLSYVHHVNF